MTDLIRFRCVACQRRLKVPRTAAGRKVRCPDCGAVQEVPPESAETESLAPPTAAPTVPSAPVVPAVEIPPPPSAQAAGEAPGGPEIPAALEPQGEHDFASREIDEAGEYRYEAFISYRHVEPDRRWAKWLHKALETYRVPARLVRQRGVAARLGRVFRDEEELPAAADLSGTIDLALQESRFLIVVCSPRTPQSEWVNKEVIRFREMGRHDRILALLIEGEPGESFPRSLREIRRTLADSAGLAREEVEEVEPLAADVRERPTERPANLRRLARLRLLACILGCRFDDLRQREHERQMRRIVLVGTIVALLAALLLGLTAVALYQWQHAVTITALARQREKTALAEQRKAEAAAQKELEATNRALAAAQKERDAKRRAEAERRNALTATQKEREAQNQAVRRLYAADMLLVQQAWNAADMPRLLAILERQRPAHTDGIDVRGFEWYYWWRLAHGDSLRRHNNRGSLPDPYALRCSSWAEICFSPDGKQLAFGNGNTVTVRDAASRKGLLVLNGHTSHILSVCFSAGGQRMASGGDNTVKVWDTRSGQEILSLKAHDAARSVCFSPDGKRLAAQGYYGTTMWNVTSGQELPALKPNGFSSDDKYLVWSEAGKMRIWDATSVKDIRGLKETMKSHKLVCFSPDGRRLVCVGERPVDAFHVLDTANGHELCTLKSGHPVCFSPDGARLVLGDGTGVLKMFDAMNGRELFAFKGLAQKILSVCFSPDGTRVAAGSWDEHSVRLWDTTIGQELLTLQVDRQSVDRVCFSPDGKYLTAYMSGSYVWMWDGATGDDPAPATQPTTRR